MDDAAERRWMEQWRAAGPALEQQRRRELRLLSDERALAAADALLSLSSPAHLSTDRLRGSGLVEQQQHLHRRQGR